ncbi:hypothetical protein M419DRAFT_97158 [Trichoderma reesei RUT C-30]|uniref:Uncharacterized protein n=1 Tax=Hypocrea jecorina (strain ATCC 56765 / BCRC 32924 / NRRL 11460 / Rut C-30) TaxID=1344414 RepID=A0A024SHK8_HYPJR|nr:hypothetical protein M419DRAFT_97158 [Trichoderma reesei RUT C-30]
MPKGVEQIHDGGSDTQGSSQRERVIQAAEGPSLRPREDGRPKYDESNDIDTEASSTVYEAGDELMGSQGDVSSPSSGVREGECPRTLRSRPAKQEPADSAEQIRGSRVISIKTRKRACDDDGEFELPSPAKRGRKPSANTEIKRFDKDLQSILARFTSKAQDSESLSSEVRELERQVKGLEVKLDKAQNAYKEARMLLKKETGRLQDEKNQLQRTTKLMIALEEAKRDSLNYVKVSDSEVSSAWMMLSYNVRDLVSQCLTEQPSNQVQRLAALVKWHRFRFSEDVPSLRTNILRRAIWRTLVSAIFRGYTRIWQGELGQYLTQTLSGNDYAFLKDPRYPKIISQTKSRVTADLDEDAHLDQDSLHSKVESLHRELQFFIPESKDREFRDKMKRLIEHAVGLHIVMMKSKAIFLVKWIGDNDGTNLTTYDPATMDTTLGNGGADAHDFYVKFVEAPGLVKIGNADGEDFDQNMVLCKSRVILGDKVDKVDLESGF